MTTRTSTSTSALPKARPSPAKRHSLPPPGAKKSEATRLRILDAAAYVLSQEGYAGTKLTDIAQHAKLRVSTLYYYFESREALVLDVLLSGSASVRTHVETAVAQLPPGTSAVDRVCAAAEAHLRYVLEISHYTEASVRNTGQLPAHMRTAVDKEHSLYGRFWQRLIDSAVGSDEAYRSPTQRRALWLLIVGALNSTVEWLAPSRASVDQVVQTALTLTRRAIGAG
ncbi:MAG: TetR/AcrR family transcriptional regulator [Burkholderiales bacterium]